jgi:hypothetical protein
VKKMAYQKLVYSSFRQGLEFKEIEFVAAVALEQKKVSPVEEKPKSTVYKLSAPISRKDLRKDRKARQKSFIQFEQPVSPFSVAKRRIFDLH